MLLMLYSVDCRIKCLAHFRKSLIDLIRWTGQQSWASHRSPVSLLDCKRSTTFIEYTYMLYNIVTIQIWMTNKFFFPVYQPRSSIIILDWQIHILCTATEGSLSRQPIMKWFLQVLKFIRHSQNWDLSHDIIILVLLKCHHTQTIYCMSHFRWNIETKNDFICCKTTNVFWIVLSSIYVPIRMYFIYIAYYFVLMFMYILVFLIMNSGCNRCILCIKLDVLFFMLSQKWRNKQVIYIYCLWSVTFS